MPSELRITSKYPHIMGTPGSQTRATCHDGCMDVERIAAESIEIVRDAALRILRPQPGECLLCFVYRHIGEFGCNSTHRFTLHYRDHMAPRATALLNRLASIGARCCECEIFFNAFEPADYLWTPERWVEDPAGQEYFEEARVVLPLPPCTGVRRGSTQPCANWQRQRYRFW